MINTILALCKPLNITHYELFSLRDADTGSTEPTGTLGITTDNYRPKLAFTLYRNLCRGAADRTPLEATDRNRVEAQPTHQ